MFTLITVYEDGFSKSETCKNITDVFAAASVYSYDKECISIVAIDVNTKNFIIDYTRG
jgi:hypothetical protein